jgi:hypothetical protein
MTMQWKELDEVVRSTSVMETPSPGPRRLPVGAWLAGLALLALAAAGAFAGERELRAMMTELDGKSLNRADLLLGTFLEAQKADLVGKARILSGDTRVRTTVMTPQFSEATVRDVLEDLRKASDATVMAVIDVRGRVQAAAGSDRMPTMADLGASPLLGQAMEKAVAHVWTFPEHVLVVGMAPVRSAGQVVALFLVGYELPEATLGSIGKTMGIDGAVVIGDKMVTTTSGAPAMAEVVKLTLTAEDGVNHVVDAGGPHLVRITRTGDSAGAGRVVWTIPMHQQGPRMLTLQILGLIPIPLVGLALVLAASLFRRGTQGQTA